MDNKDNNKKDTGKIDPMAFARQEALIKRMEEVKHDSVKIGLLEEICRQLKDIKEFLINNKKENLEETKDAKDYLTEVKEFLNNSKKEIEGMKQTILERKPSMEESD